jgi:hypothetical protein
VVEDVVDRVVVGEGGVDEREGCAGDGHEAHQAGAAAREDGIDAERQPEIEREGAEGRHGVRHQLRSSLDPYSLKLGEG